MEGFGSLDGRVLNAGIVRAGMVGELRDEDWKAMVRTNLTGPFRILRAAIPQLVAARGAIVGVASAAALRASGGIPGYNATKAGLTMLVQSVAVDYGPLPGCVRTPYAPAGPEPKWPTWKCKSTVPTEWGNRHRPES